MRRQAFSVLLLGTLILAGCDDLGGVMGMGPQVTEDFHYTEKLQPGGSLSVENMNGSIEVSGWERDTVEINGSKYAHSDSALRAIKIDVVSTGDAVRIRTIGPSGYRGGMGAKYVIRVPQKTRLDRIESSNASIRIEGMEGSARLRTSNGAVRVYRLAGPVDIRTSNGGVELTDINGTVTAQTSNGGIQAEGVHGSLEATTSNGRITARLNDPEPNRPVKLTSSNGHVELSMDAVRQNDIRISTSNSGITVRLPSSLNASVRAHTSNSSIQNEYEVKTTGSLSKHHLEGTIGSGGPLVDLSTSNGNIRIARM